MFRFKKMLLNSLNLTFLFSPYRFNIESINIKNECSQFKNNHPEYISLCKRLDVFCLQFPIAMFVVYQPYPLT